MSDWVPVDPSLLDQPVKCNKCSRREKIRNISGASYDHPNPDWWLLDTLILCPKCRIERNTKNHPFSEA